jgi:uncharacterized protein (DUF433 family)
MWTSMEPWQVAQLERLSRIDHDRVETALNSLWQSCPEIFQQITIAAIDESQITRERGAQILKLSLDDVDQMLADFRRKALKRCCVVVTGGSAAKLADGGLPVWEVVRVFRKVGSMEKLQEAFNGVSPQTLESALEYAEANPDEIEKLISRYEEMVERRRAEYPFA